MCLVHRCSYTVWNALVWAGIITGVPPILARFPGLSFAGLGLGLLPGSASFETTWLYAGGAGENLSGCPPSLTAAGTGGRGLGTRGALLCTIDCVEEAPERELPDREEESELGFTSLALGASASSL